MEASGIKVPLFDADKLRDIVDDIVKRHPITQPLTKTRVYAAWEKDATTREVHCFNELDPMPIPDKAVAATAAEGLFKKAVLHSATGELVTFMDTVYPLGLIDPTALVIKEIKETKIFGTIDEFISIGPGRVDDGDIPDLLRLGIRAPSSTASIEGSILQSIGGGIRRLFRWIYSTTLGASTDSNASNPQSQSENLPGSSKDEETNWSPEKVIEHLDKSFLEILECIEPDKYFRFEINPVPNLGPNDFLSLKEVGKATDEYLEFLQLPPCRQEELPKSGVPTLTDDRWHKREYTSALNLAIRYGYWPRVLDLAISCERVQYLKEECWREILKHNPDIATKTVGEFATLLHRAAASGYLQLAKDLLELDHRAAWG
ncbi:hypothetical protein ABKA04_005149 [Annulohypoxylon sp. FPYF3050]